MLVDFDGTLHDTESVYTPNLKGLFGLDRKKLYHVFPFDIHKKIIHKQYPQRYDACTHNPETWKIGDTPEL